MAAPTIGRRSQWAGLATSIDRSHPLSQGLLFCAQAPGWVDLANGASPSTNLSVMGASRTGPTAEFSTVADTNRSVGWSAAPALNRPCTIMWTGRLTATAGVYIGFGSTGNYGKITSVGANTIALSLRSIADYPGVTAPSTASVFAVTLVGTTATYYADGVALGSDTISAATASVGFYIGIWALGQTAVRGSVGMAAAWGRQLTSGEISLFAADPFCMLRY